MAEDGAPGWARDHVVTELRRRFPEPLSGAELQEATGIGTEDLRAVVQELDAEGWLEGGEHAHGYVLTEVGYDPETADQPAAIGQPMGAAVEADPEPEGDEDPAGGLEDREEAIPGPPAQPQGVGPHPEEPVRAFERAAAAEELGETRYSARILLDVGYFPEQKDGESADEAALREARMFQDVCEDELKTRWPDLPVTATLVSLDAYDNPRRIV